MWEEEKSWHLKKKENFEETTHSLTILSTFFAFFLLLLRCFFVLKKVEMIILNLQLLKGVNQ